MLFTPVIALAGLAAAAPQGLVHRRATNDTVPAYKFSRSTQIVNGTAPADVKLSSRSTLNGNYTAPAGIKLVSRSAPNFNTTYPPGLSVTPSS